MFTHYTQTELVFSGLFPMNSLQGTTCAPTALSYARWEAVEMYSHISAPIMYTHRVLPHSSWARDCGALCYHGDSIGTLSVDV